MPKIDWIWYHTQNVGTAAGDYTYFDTDQATSGIAVTNMKMAGQLPAAEKFTIKEINVLIDPAAADADVAILKQDCVLELVIGETTIITAPLYNFIREHANLRLTLENPISLAGGVGFKVVLHLGTAVSAATSVTVQLVGVREY